MAMDITLRRATWILCSFGALFAGGLVAAEPVLFQSRQIARSGEYTFGIEGPAVDTAGNLYVVNFQRAGTIGRLKPSANASELFLTLPEGSIGNSIRFARDGRMFIADYKKHNIFVAAPGSTALATYFHSNQFNQPNDMTIAADGTIYASDPNWKRRDGRVWKISRAADGTVSGEIMTSPRAMTTTNGLDLSPDGQTLYVGESETLEIWAYRIEGTTLAAPRLVKKFDGQDIDGIRSDIDGRLFVTRMLKGTVVILDASGRQEREIPLTAAEPSNLAFGGADGRTVYVTQRKGGYIESFMTDRPGREFCLQGDRCLGLARPRR
ncbi:gluconolactonase [Rhodoplanes sp. Z2-YC6860]|nr:gluconolactonase [Rhodoplanes sp. Z2-YC6860]